MNYELKIAFDFKKSKEYFGEDILPYITDTEE